MNWFNLLGSLCLLATVVICTDAAGSYSIVGPGTIHSNQKYNVIVSLHDAEVPCKINVGITGPSFNTSQEVRLQPRETVNVDFDVPELKSGDYNLTAVGVEGILFENSTMLNYADHSPSIYIQTDKATYKPSDLVNFRVLFLDKNTRPADVQNDYSIVISDGARNRIKMFKDIEIVNGVYANNLTLSDLPVLGQWVIEVTQADSAVTSKIFDVDKYVLPKFEVIIETAKDVAIADNIVMATIRAKYTYGKSVKGKAVVSLKTSYPYYYSEPAMASEKTIAVDGKGHVEFNLQKDLGLHVQNDVYNTPSLQMLAVVEDELTGNKQNTTATITLHSFRYTIESVDTPYNFELDKPVFYTLVVKNVDGSPVRNSNNLVKLTFEVDTYIDRLDTSDRVQYESPLNADGMATFEVKFSNKNISYYSVKGSYLDTTTRISSISKKSPSTEETSELKIHVISKEPRLNQLVTVEISSKDLIPYFVYTVVGRGNILLSERVDVPDGRKSHTLQFLTTFEMMPTAKLYVHYVVDNNLRFEEALINVEKAFENSLEIMAPVEAKPSDNVTLTIRTDPNSLVGLLGVDQSVLLLKSGNDLNRDAIFNDLNKYDTTTPWMRGYGRYPGQTSGLVTLTNANFPYNDDIVRRRPIPFYAPPGIPGMVLFNAFPQALARPAPLPLPTPKSNIAVKPTIRRSFLEVWMFNSYITTGADEFSFARQIPDTITSWVVTGFSLNPNTGIALTQTPTNIKVFQPFFVSTNLPYSVKRGEVIAIPVIVYNYMDKDLDAEVTMDNIDREYEFTEATNEIDESTIDEIKRTKRLTIPSNSGKSASFMIRPTKVGSITLKITAITPLAGDAIYNILKVEPEGLTKYENRAIFVNLQSQGSMQESIQIDIPADAVPDSEYIEISVIGDFSVGPSIQNLDNLVRMPYGCGEQNMVNFVPNILVLKYLKTINKSLPSVEEKAKNFMEIGYQRELTYKHDDGSYSAFGKSDPAGSTWLTAYVVRSFHQAKDFIEIDNKVLMEGLNYLASVQADDGSFTERGKLFDSAHQNGLALTGFVLWAFLENKDMVAEHDAVIKKATDYLLTNAKTSNDVYALSIAVYALQLTGSATDEIVSKLEGMAQKTDNLMWWTKHPETQNTADVESWSYRPQNNDVEITSYVLLALLEIKGAEECLPIIKWLIKQRNSNGGFPSTQDTVMGLQALISFAEKTGAGNSNLNVAFTAAADDGSTKLEENSFTVNADNALLLQTETLPQTTRQVNLTATGEGSCLVQIAYRYNVVVKDDKPRFKLRNAVNENPTTHHLSLEVCATYEPTETEEPESNMVVLEAQLPSGYNCDDEDFGKIEAVEPVKRVESKNSKTMIIIYFDSLIKGEEKCITIEADKLYAVAKQKPSTVTIYDYYATDKRATEFYEIKSSLCDICEGEDCGSGCAAVAA